MNNTFMQQAGAGCMRRRPQRQHALAYAITLGLGLTAASMPALAQDAAPPEDGTAAQTAEVQALAQELDALKSSYVSEVRRLREIDARVQALQARLNGKLAPLSGSSTASSAAPPASTPAPNAEHEKIYAGNQAEAAKNIQPQRSVEDVLQQQHALFNRPLTLEAGISYGYYDRRQLTLNGFLALDAIFLGNIAIEGVKSNTVSYNFAARYGVTPRLTLNLDVPFIQRWTNYQKGGAGGSAAALAEENVYDGPALGDVTASANFRLFNETPGRPNVILTGGVIAPTGREPYGIDTRIIENHDTDTNAANDNSNDMVRFAVPSKQATGNGVWSVNLGATFIKTMDPAIVFGSFSYQHSLSQHFDDLDTSPDTKSPGKVFLGDTFSFGAGVAFAFNDRTSMSLSFVDKIVREAKIKMDGKASQPVIGSSGNAGTMNLGVTYALNEHFTLVTLLGIGLTPDAPDFTLNVKVPFQM